MIDKMFSEVVERAEPESSKFIKWQFALLRAANKSSGTDGKAALTLGSHRLVWLF